MSGPNKIRPKYVLPTWNCMVSTLKMALKHIHFPYLPDLDADFFTYSDGIKTDVPIKTYKHIYFSHIFGSKNLESARDFPLQAMALTSLQALPAEKLRKALPAVKQGILKRCHGEELEELQLNGGETVKPKSWYL